jgi:hypothetical protein
MEDSDRLFAQLEARVFDAIVQHFIALGADCSNALPMTDRRWPERVIALVKSGLGKGLATQPPERDRREALRLFDEIERRVQATHEVATGQAEPPPQSTSFSSVVAYLLSQNYNQLERQFGVKEARAQLKLLTRQIGGTPITGRPRKLPVETLAAMKEARDRGDSLTTIAKRHHTTRHRVSAELRHHYPPVKKR